MTPEMVGASREFVLGKHTGTHSVRKRLQELDYDPSDSEVRAVTKLVKEFGAEKEQVTDSVITRFAEEVGVSEAESEEVRV
jgi:2-isopropylmalate synthase